VGGAKVSPPAVTNSTNTEAKAELEGEIAKAVE